MKRFITAIAATACLFPAPALAVGLGICNTEPYVLKNGNSDYIRQAAREKADLLRWCTTEDILDFLSKTYVGNDRQDMSTFTNEVIENFARQFDRNSLQPPSILTEIGYYIRGDHSPSSSLGGVEAKVEIIKAVSRTWPENNQEELFEVLQSGYHQDTLLEISDIFLSQENITPEAVVALARYTSKRARIDVLGDIHRRIVNRLLVLDQTNINDVAQVRKYLPDSQQRSLLERSARKFAPLDEEKLVVILQMYRKTYKVSHPNATTADKIIQAVERMHELSYDSSNSSMMSALETIAFYAKQ